MLRTPISGMTEAIMVFNFLPATYTDPSWIDAPDPWRNRLARLKAPAARQVLSEWLLEQHGVADSFDFDFSSIEKALFLQDAGGLQRLAAIVGLLRQRADVRKMAAGGVLPRLASELGNDSLGWVLARLPEADFLPPSAYGIDYDEKALMPQFAACGIPCLLGLVMPQSHAVAVRARLKFPRHLLYQPAIVFSQEAREAFIAYLKAHVFKEGASWE